MKYKFKKNIALSALLLGGIINIAQAEVFWATGTIKRTLSEGPNFGGCMIALSTTIGHACNGSWVSLDCNGGYSNSGERHYATALMAFSLQKNVSVEVDNEKVYNGYCVAKRIDVLNN